MTDTNLSYTNPGKMGDNDGPAVCVYAKPGYFRASLDIAVTISECRPCARTAGLSTRTFSSASIFWMRAPPGSTASTQGLVRSGRNGAWHLFYNVYATPEGKSAWYESSVKLSADSDYRLVLDTSKEDEKAILSVYEIGSERLIDSVSFSAADMLCDGSNTAYYQNFALDFPDDLKVGADGKPGVSYDAADWPAMRALQQRRRLVYAEYQRDRRAPLWAGRRDGLERGRQRDARPVAGQNRFGHRLCLHPRRA